ncbi:MAG: carboxypeptidase M32 [Lachnospiraceae bacterium]|nr:carboxypeptidase M32 [Lachnospiraceae bacterium]
MNQKENHKNQIFEALSDRLERAMAYQTALTLLEWDNETLAPVQAGALTSRVQGTLSAAYQEVMTSSEVKLLISQCEKQPDLSRVERDIVREAKEDVEKLDCIPPEEYRAFQELVSESTRIWVKAKKEQDFSAFAPTLQKIISYQKKFAGYRAKDGQKLYDVMLDDYEKDFNMEKLDAFFQCLKKELVPLLKQITESRVRVDDAFLTGDYPEEKQRKLAEYMASYVGFDFEKGVLATSAHPFTTNLHNRDVRITTHYQDRVDSSLFSVIHEAGHGIYEQGIADELTQTPVGQGASMGMHESQSRFFENIIGRNEAFWVPVYGTLKDLFPDQLRGVGREMFVRAINKVEPGLIRTEADELTYSLHVLVRYELEKQLIEEDLDVEKLPELWADKYEEYLGVRPDHVAEGVLQDIHWAQGSFGYFPSYALGSAFGAQIYACMKREMDFDKLLEDGKIDVIREYLREHIHQHGKLKTSRQLIRDMTGEDFNPQYYVDYLKEKYGKLYQLEG